MMIKNYFDHTNKENKSPFDRMEEEGINYKNAGENIAQAKQRNICTSCMDELFRT